MADSMVERVARAAQCEWSQAQELIGLPPEEWDGLKEPVRHYWRVTARAAIAAMREPTEAMLVAGHQAHAADPNSVLPAVWRAMINAVLAE